MKNCFFTLHPGQYELLLVNNHSDNLRWNLKIVLICIFLIAKGMELFLKCFLVICDSTIGQYFFFIKTCSLFLIRLLWFFYTYFLEFFMYYDISLLSDVLLVKNLFLSINLPLFPIDCIPFLSEALQFHQDSFINYWS